jgi:3-hydroxybutyryl-CoA dehydrogenase
VAIDEIKTICVAGAGTMGAQIAQQSALGGYDVWLIDVSEDQLAKAVESNTKLVMRRVEAS